MLSSSYAALCDNMEPVGISLAVSLLLDRGEVSLSLADGAVVNAVFLKGGKVVHEVIRLIIWNDQPEDLRQPCDMNEGSPKCSLLRGDFLCQQKSSKTSPPIHASPFAMVKYFS